MAKQAPTTTSSLNPTRHQLQSEMFHGRLSAQCLVRPTIICLDSTPVPSMTKVSSQSSPTRLRFPKRLLVHSDSRVFSSSPQDYQESKVLGTMWTPRDCSIRGRTRTLVSCSITRTPLGQVHPWSRTSTPAARLHCRRNESSREHSIG